MRVGLAYVPGPGHAVTADVKQKLLVDLAQEFESRSFISDVVVLPPHTLRPSGGFADLDQLAQVVLLKHQETQKVGALRLGRAEASGQKAKGAR